MKNSLANLNHRAHRIDEEIAPNKCYGNACACERKQEQLVCDSISIAKRMTHTKTKKLVI